MSEPLLFCFLSLFAPFLAIYWLVCNFLYLLLHLRLFFSVFSLFFVFDTHTHTGPPITLRRPCSALWPGCSDTVDETIWPVSDQTTHLRTHTQGQWSVCYSYSLISCLYVSGESCQSSSLSRFLHTGMRPVQQLSPPETPEAQSDWLWSLWRLYLTAALKWLAAEEGGA